MGRKPNDGRGRLGGRAKGTPNKKPFSVWVAELADNNRQAIEKEINEGSREGLQLLGALMIADGLCRCSEAAANQTSL